MNYDNYDLHRMNIEAIAMAIKECRAFCYIGSEQMQTKTMRLVCIYL